jgi:Winged helix DNA-binding domain
VTRLRKQVTLTTRQLNRALLARQLLLKRKRVSVHAAVHATGGLQSQEPRDPFVALWSRISGFKAEHLLEAARNRSLVRGTYLRGTLHTAAAGDYAALRLLLQPVIHREEKIRREYGGGFETEKLECAARALLALGPLSTQQLGEALAPKFPKAPKIALAAWPRTGLPLIAVPTDDRWGYSRPPRFVLADQWLGEPLQEPGTAENLVLRCLSAMGPASASDVRAWSGLGGIKPILERLREQLTVFGDESGRELFDLPGAPRPDAETPAPVRFLPEYDNVFLSHADRGRIIDAVHGHHFTHAKNGRRLRSVLVDGFVRAGWAVSRTAGRATMQVWAFEKLSKSTVAELSGEAEALLRFTEPDATEFSIDLVTPRETRP